MFRHLTDEGKRNRLGALRDGVQPILANNLQPYYTAHDIGHCDRVSEVIDDLVDPLQWSDQRLNDEELFVLYAAAYLHDIGMQYENVGASRTVLAEIGGQRWEDISNDERRDLLRRLHPQISAELVVLSTRNASPPIGFQLNDMDHPNVIASLCEAHGIDSNSPRYEQLTEAAPKLRTALLSGILRCADILEESRRRALRPRAESLALPIQSQVHWWRHYYTIDVGFDQSQRTITIWFEFPSSQRDELSRIVPNLQFPGIQAEFRRHDEVFAANGLTWFVRSRVHDNPYNTSEELPEAVLYEMLLQGAARRQEEARGRQRALSATHQDARPFLDRTLQKVREMEATGIDPVAVVSALQQLASQMKGLGAESSARTLLREAFSKAEGGAAETKLSVGFALLQLLLESGQFDEAVRCCHQLAPAIATLPSLDERIDQYWGMRIDAEMRAGFFEDSLKSIQTRSALKGAADSIDVARTDELRFLLLDSPEISDGH